MAESHFLAVQEYGSGVGLVHPGQHLHQGGLARAVFPHEPVYLAPVKAEMGILQYGYAEKTLGQSADFQDWRGSRRAGMERLGSIHGISFVVVLHRCALHELTVTAPVLIRQEVNERSLLPLSGRSLTA